MDKVQEIQEIREALHAATPGPWKLAYDRQGHPAFIAQLLGVTWGLTVIDFKDIGFEILDADARLFANSRKWLSYLLSELDAAESRYQTLASSTLECARERDRFEADVSILQQQLDAAKQQLSDLCPIADFDVITSLQTEKAHMRDEISELRKELDAAKQENERLRQIRYNATEAHLNIQTGLVEQIETLQQRLKQAEEALNIQITRFTNELENAKENRNATVITLNQMILEVLYTIRGETNKEEPTQ
jgi:predicted  nucleic acid-binding Zn-ribbon protein